MTDNSDLRAICEAEIEAEKQATELFEAPHAIPELMRQARQTWIAARSARIEATTPERILALLAVAEAVQEVADAWNARRRHPD